MSTATDITKATPEETTKARALALVEQSGRVPDIRDDETSSKASDLVKLLTVAATAWEELRVAKKAPHLQECRDIDAEFKATSDKIEAAKRAVKAKQTAYLIAKEAEIKRLADEAAKKSQEAALAAAAEAEAAGDNVEAEKALEAAVTAPAAVHVQSRGSFGSTSSLRSTWTYRVSDFAKLPDAYKVANTQALGALAKSGRPAIPGVEWVEQRTATTR